MELHKYCFVHYHCSDEPYPCKCLRAHTPYTKVLVYAGGQEKGSTTQAPPTSHITAEREYCTSAADRSHDLTLLWPGLCQADHQLLPAWAASELLLLPVQHRARFQWQNRGGCFSRCSLVARTQHLPATGRDFRSNARIS